MKNEELLGWKVFEVSEGGGRKEEIQEIDRLVGVGNRNREMRG